MRPLQRLLYVRICVRVWLTVHARVCCQPNTFPSVFFFRIILQCDDLFLSFCVVRLSWSMYFFLYNILFIHVYFFSVMRLHHFILCFLYLQMKCWLDGEAASKICLAACMLRWWLACRERHHSLRSGMCVPVSKGCSYAIWQAVFYGKSNLGDFVLLPDQLNDLWASLIELVSSSWSQAYIPVCYIPAAYENLFMHAEMIAIHGHKVS